MAGKYSPGSKERVSSPGPSDYKVNPIRFLKNYTRVTIGKSKRESSIEVREKSPGPSSYHPNRLNWKKRAVGVRFNREIRAGIVQNEKNVTPGPGDYMIPCKFLVRPRFMEHKENKFRFV